MVTAFPDDSVLIEQSLEDDATSQARRSERKRTPKDFGDDFHTGKLPQQSKDGSDKSIKKDSGVAKTKGIDPNQEQANKVTVTVTTQPGYR